MPCTPVFGNPFNFRQVLNKTRMSLAISSFILGIVFCAPPGIITAETVRRGFARGFRPALLVQFGSLVGDSTWSLIALTGLAFLVQNNTARIILSVVGIGIMLKLAWDALKAARTATEAHPRALPHNMEILLLARYYRLAIPSTSFFGQALAQLHFPEFLGNHSSPTS